MNDAPIFDPYSHLLAEQLGPVVFVAQGIVSARSSKSWDPRDTTRAFLMNPVGR